MSVARVLVLGSANVDFTVAAPRLPGPGETVTDGTLLVNHGGKGANQAVAARRLGADVRFIACVGDDATGRAVRVALEREGIARDGIVTTPDAATGTALIVVDREGRNQITVAPGANRRLSIDHVRARREDLAWARIVVCQLEIPLDTVAWAVAEARRLGAVTIVNPAPVPDASIGFWPSIDYLTPNEVETARLAGLAVADRDGACAAAAALRSRGVGTVVITLGDRGALACDAHGITEVPAYPVTPVDTTAAGDAFNAGLAVALAEDRPLTEALTFASAAAALTCTRRGAQDSLPARAEVERLMCG